MPREVPSAPLRAVLIDPSLPREEWTRPEEDLLYALHDQLGNRWAVIGHRLGNRYSLPHPVPTTA
jgi:hypothetical protein